MMRYGMLALATMLFWLGLTGYYVQRYPSAQVEAAMAEMIERAGGPNRFVHEQLPDADWRTIVRPSTDLLYSAFPYDLRDGPLALTFPPHDDYWSVQFVDIHTSSFAHVGSPTGTTIPTRVVLAENAVPEEDAVEAPSTRGVLLLRYLVRNPAEDVPTLDALRREVRVGKWGSE